MKKHSLAVCLFASLLLNAFFALRPRSEAAPKARDVATPPAPSPILPEIVVVREPAPPADVAPRPTPRAAFPVISLLARPTYIEPGREITVTCTVHAGGASSRDWIGLFPVGASVTGHKAYLMAVEESGTYYFKAPTAPGAYELRYILDDDRTSVASSGVVTVLGNLPPPPLVRVESLATTVRRGQEIPACVAIYAGQVTDKDWIGLYAPDAKNEQYLTWMYAAPTAGGPATLKAPDQPGVYEIRYLLDNGYESVATSARIVVTE